MLPLHPKSTLKYCPELKWKNLVYRAGSARFKVSEISVIVHLLRIKAHFHLFLLYEFNLCLLFLFIDYIWISFYHKVCPINWLPNRYQYILTIFTNFDESRVWPWGLALFLERVIVLYTIYPEMLQKIPWDQNMVDIICN